MTTTAPAPPVASSAPTGGPAGMTHRQILEALSGLLLGLFVAILSSTVVSNALPTILNQLHGGESAYTWVVTAALLAITASTPIWGKLSDLTSKKALVQLSLVIYVVGSIVAGLSVNTGMLIACRVVQGIGAGGLTALTQVCLAAMVSPRERGRYSGYLGAVFAVATVTGPLVGGLIVDTSWLGWRWCFYVGVPFAVAAIILLQKTLHLPTIRRDDVRIDWAGATLIAASVSLLLIWVSLAGHSFAWGAWETPVMVAGAVVLGGLAVLVESRATEPVIPLHLFRVRTISLAMVASLFIGVGLFGATVFLSQYFQISRGASPTRAGLETLPLVGGLFLSSVVSGQVITRTGRWKGWLVAGAALVTVGFALLGTIRAGTSYGLLALFMGVLGIGVGMALQNLVLAVQNAVSVRELGVASSTVAFFRSLGGAVGVSALGALLSHRVGTEVASASAAAGIPAGSSALSTSEIPDISALPAPIARIVQDAYGTGSAQVFLVAAPLGLLALVAVLFIRNAPLRTTTGDVPAPAAAADVPPAAGTDVPPAAGTDVPPAAGTDVSPAAGADVPPALSNRARLVGHVRGAEHETLPGTVVTVTDPAGTQVGRAVCDDTGAYRVDLATGGTYVLIATAPGHQPLASTVTVAGDEVRRDLTLSGAGALSGRVTDTTGAPAGGASVSVADARGDVVAAVLADPTGTWSVDDLHPGDYTLVAAAPGLRPDVRSVTVDESRDNRCDLVLSGRGSLTGIVRVASSGDPLGDASVVLVDAGGATVGETVSDPAGRYGFEGVRPGSYTILASGYAPAALRVRVGEGAVDGRDLELARDVDRSGRLGRHAPVAETPVRR